MLALLFALQLAASEPQATLCIDGRCSAVDATSRKVAAADTPRGFVWIAPDQKRIVAGSLAANETALPLDAQRESHRLTIRFSGATVPVTFALDDAWSWTMTPPRGVIEIEHDKAARITIRAHEHKPVEQPLDKQNLGTITLHRYPILSGSIIDATTATPLAGVRIDDAHGHTIAESDASGRFRAAIEEAWPSVLHVWTPRHAPKEVTVPKAITDTTLPPIRLSAGGTVRATIEGAPGDELLRWQLREIIDEWQDKLRREGRLIAGETSFTIDRVEAGEYRLVVGGDGPLEQSATSLRVREASETEARVLIRPLEVKIRTRLGDEPLAGANVSIRHTGMQWTGTVKIDDAGEATATLWQRGRLKSTVMRPPVVAAWEGAEEFDENDEGPATWTMKIEDRRLRGRLVNARNGEPVANATLLLELRGVDTDEWQAVRGYTAADGTFEFGGLFPGRHVLEVFKPRYRPNQKWTFSVSESERLQDVELKLEPYAAERKLHVVNSRAIPIANAALYFAGRTGIREVLPTDANGDATIPLTSREETGTVFIVPRSGSFAFVRIRPENEGQEIIVRVPDGNAALELRAETTGDAPVPNVGVIIQFNGMLLPIEVLYGLMRHQGVPVRTDANGRLLFPLLPAGQYELWPYASQEEFRAAYFGPRPAPAVNIAVAEGQQTVALKLERR